MCVPPERICQSSICIAHQSCNDTPLPGGWDDVRGEGPGGGGEVFVYADKGKEDEAVNKSLHLGVFRQKACPVVPQSQVKHSFTGRGTVLCAILYLQLAHLGGDYPGVYLSVHASGYSPRQKSTGKNFSTSML